MLEDYFVRPQTIERIRLSWVGSAIEQYLARLEEQGYATQRLGQRVPILVRFGEFAQARGAQSYAELPTYLDSFVDFWVKRRSYRQRVTPPRRLPADAVTRRIEAMLRVVVPGFVGHTRRRISNEPFVDRAPGFFTYLREERGLREGTLGWYGNHLRQFDAYLIRRGIRDLQSLSPDIISGFLTDRARGLQPSYVRIRGTVLRMFLRYLHREGVVARDLSPTVEAVPVYRLAKIPRAITIDEVNQMLSGVNRQSVIGRRDYAILLLLVTYGLRAREVAALTLDNLDWQHDRLRIPERKAGHSTVYPLSPVVGKAIIDYLKEGRPKTTSRHVFLHETYPRGPITHVAVAHRAAHYLHKAGIAVPRAGSHTLRHTCVQRLVDAGWPLKQIGDYVGHGDPRSTEIYSKVALDVLRQVACGDGEEIV
jgi:site-specific recombinase XerD